MKVVSGGNGGRSGRGLYEIKCVIALLGWATDEDPATLKIGPQY